MRPAPLTTETPAPDPFRYGWRYVPVTLPDGSEDLEQVPLTLEDVLHPQEGDVIPETGGHERICRYLADVFRSRTFGPAVVRVTADLLINWGVEGVRNTSPDVGVFVGLETEPDIEEGTFDLVESRGRCVLVVEVVSPDTRNNDVVRKRELYHRVGLPLYFYIDQQREGGPRTLIGLRWRTQGYEQMPLDEQGRLLIDFLGIYLALRDGRAVCFDAETGKELGDYTRISRELEEADRRIQAQELALEDSAREMREVAKQRDEAAKQRDEVAKQRNEVSKQRDQVTNDLLEHKKRIQELEELCRRLQVNTTSPPG